MQGSAFGCTSSCGCSAQAGARPTIFGIASRSESYRQTSEPPPSPSNVSAHMGKAVTPITPINVRAMNCLFFIVPISACKVVGASSPAHIPWAGKRPPVVYPPPRNNVPSNNTINCVPPAGTIDLERNSADAIAPAMTSSALLPHHKSVGVLIQTLSATLRRGNYAAFARESLNPNSQTQRRIRPTSPDCQPQRSPLPLRFSGEGTFLENRIRRPKTTTWKRRVLPTSCGCQEETLHIVFYSDSGRTKRVTGGWFACFPDSSPPARRVQCQFSVQRSESL